MFCHAAVLDMIPSTTATMLSTAEYQGTEDSVRQTSSQRVTR